MNIELNEVSGRRELKGFIHLPARIHRDHPRWVPPIYSEEWKHFSPKTNKAFSYCDTKMVLAARNGQLVGRIMGIVNHRYNDAHGEKTGRFAYLECWNDEEVVHSLLRDVEDWARQRGMNKICGPLGFSDQDPEGYLIQGFEFEPTLATYYNFEYLIRFLESAAYSKDVDYVVYKVPMKIPDVYERIRERILRNTDVTLLEFTRRRDLKTWVHPMLGLMNETFEGFYGYVPLDEREMTALAKQYSRMVDPRFVKIVVQEDEVVAFMLAIPNMSEGFRRAKGRLFPLGLYWIMRSARETKQLDLLLGAIKESHRRRGLDVIMGTATINSGIAAGFEFMDSHHELESNVKVRAEMERVGGQVYKRFRVFQKEL